MPAKEGEYSVKIDGIPEGTRTEELRELFSFSFSTITDVYLPAIRGKTGFGFVRFSVQEDALDAAALPDLEIRGNPLICELTIKEKRAGGRGPSGGHDSHSRGDPPAKVAKGGGGGEHSIWFGNLPAGVVAEDLDVAVRRVGVDTMTDVYIPPSKDFGFVRFASHEEAATAAKRCQGLKVFGTLVDLKLSKTEKRGSAVAELPPPAAGTWATDGRGYEARGFASKGWDGSGLEGKGLGLDGKGYDGYARDAPRWEGKGCNGRSHEVSSSRGSGCPGSAPRPGKGPKDRSEVSVKVGHISRRTATDDIRKAFEDEGVQGITDVYIPASKTFGFVRFLTHDEADEAVRRCDGLTINGVAVSLEVADGAKRSPGEMSKPKDDGRGGMWEGSDDFVGGPSFGDDLYGKGYGKGFFDMGAAYEKGYSGEVGKSANAKGYSGDVGYYEKGHGKQLGWKGGYEATGPYGGKGLGGGKGPFDEWGGYGKGDPWACGGLYGKGYDFFHGGENCAYGNDAYSGKVGVVDFSSRSHGGEGETGEISVKVGNLPDGVSPEEISDVFRAQGFNSLSDCYIPYGKRFGFVRFSSPAEAHDCLHERIMLRGRPLELEASAGKKRRPNEVGSELPRERRHEPALERRFEADSVPIDPTVTKDAPSVKVSGLPSGATSEELHRALQEAGCKGRIVDVYIPKGDRGFGFARFDQEEEAADAAFLECHIRGATLVMEMSKNDRKVRTDFEEDGHGPRRGGETGARPGPYERRKR